MAQHDKHPKPPEEPAKAVGFDTYDPKGVWYRSNAAFDIEDPTLAQKAGGPAALPKLKAGGYTQTTETPWTIGQWKAGVLTKFSGRPNDDGVHEVPYVEPPKAAPASEVRK